MKSVLDDIPVKVIDQDSATIYEIQERMCAQSETPARDYARKMVNSGRWEKCFKMIGKRAVPAYRRAKKSTS